MGSQVSLPLWVVVLMAILAILAALDRILIPSVRWALRRRANRSIEELNTKLKLRIQALQADQASGADRSSGVRPGSAAGGGGIFDRNRRAERSRDGKGAALRPRDRSGLQ